MEYGMNEKRLSFMDTDKRAAELIIRLKHDGLTKTNFFRYIVTGYLERDPHIVAFIDTQKENKDFQSKSKAKKVRTLESAGQSAKAKLGLEDSEIQNIFDILEKEHPDL